MMCITAMKSMTLAIKGRDALERAGIRCRVVNLEPSLTSRGCAYGISLSCENVDRAVSVMDKKHIEYGEILGRGGAYGIS